MKFTTALVALATAFSAVQAQNTLLNAVVATEDLQTLEDLAVKVGADVTGPLGDASATLTAFAPLDSAFASAGLDIYTTDPYILHLKDVLLYHVTGSVLAAANIPMGSTEVTMLNGAGDTVTVTNSMNGVTVTDTQGNVVNVVAPDAAVVDNGVAHAIDGVLLPSWAGMSVTDTASMVSRFSTLVAAASAAGLVETLDTTMGITVFAPNNDAFDAALTALGVTLDELVADTDMLAKILQYHVVAAVAPSVALTNGMMPATLEGSPVTIGVTDMGVTVNGANIVTADILVNNGIIHEIDAVLLPPEDMETPEPTVMETPEPTDSAVTVGTAAALGAMAAAAMMF